MQKVLTIYRCPACGFESDDIGEAMACLSRPFQPEFEVGDIVVEELAESYHRFGWFDGDPRWVYHKGKDPHSKNAGNSFYYVVTHIEMAGRASVNPTPGSSFHRVAYHLRTLAMSGKQGLRGGWTTMDGHIRIKKVPNPPAYIIQESKQLLGQRSQELL